MGDPKVKVVLTKTEDFLKRNLLLTNNTINKLLEAGVITDVARAKMMKESSSEQVATLVYVLKHRSMDAFKKFLLILQQSMDGWIANRILDTPINESSITHNLLKAQTLREYYKGDLFSEEEQDDIRPTKFAPLYSSDPLLGSTNDLVPGHSYKDSTFGTSLSMPRKMRDLHVDFETQKLENDNALSVLRQEERAIKDLLYQNSREQAHLQENQRALHGIERRLEQIQSEAGPLLMRAPPREVEARRRLHKLHNIPWSKPYY